MHYRLGEIIGESMLKSQNQVLTCLIVGIFLEEASWKSKNKFQLVFER